MAEIRTVRILPPDEWRKRQINNIKASNDFQETLRQLARSKELVLNGKMSVGSDKRMESYMQEYAKIIDGASIKIKNQIKGNKLTVGSKTKIASMYNWIENFENIKNKRIEKVKNQGVAINNQFTNGLRYFEAKIKTKGIC